MAGEAEVVNPVDELSDMNAGFSDEPRVPTETPEPVDEQETVPVEEETPAPKTVEITEDVYNRLLQAADEVNELKAGQQKMLDTVNGRIGRALADIKATGSAQEVTVDDFPELNEEFSELAPMIVRGVNNAIGKNRGGSVDPAFVEKVIAEKFGTALEDARQVALDSLNDIVEDWNGSEHQAIVDWVDTQGDDVKGWANSQNVSDAARLLRAYKKRPKPAPVQAALAKPNTRQQRLEAAVIPKGTGGHASTRKTEIEEMQAGYEE